MRWSASSRGFHTVTWTGSKREADRCRSLKPSEKMFLRIVLRQFHFLFLLWLTLTVRAVLQTQVIDWDVVENTNGFGTFRCLFAYVCGELEFCPRLLCFPFALVCSQLVFVFSGNILHADGVTGTFPWILMCFYTLGAVVMKNKSRCSALPEDTLQSFIGHNESLSCSLFRSLML